MTQKDKLEKQKQKVGLLHEIWKEYKKEYSEQENRKIANAWMEEDMKCIELELE